MKYFSFRAERLADIERFRAECVSSGLVVSLMEYPGDESEDVRVELQTKAPIMRLLDAARRVPDGHIIFQTLRECRLADNSLERDYHRRWQAI
jgi:hypothetical protein